MGSVAESASLNLTASQLLPLRNFYSLMKTILSLSPAAQLETECLGAVVLDRAEKDRSEKTCAEKDKAGKEEPEAYVPADKTSQQSAADLLSSGDIAGKTFELAWLHKPAGLKSSGPNPSPNK